MDAFQRAEVLLRRVAEYAEEVRQWAARWRALMDALAERSPAAAAEVAKLLLADDDAGLLDDEERQYYEALIAAAPEPSAWSAADRMVVEKARELWEALAADEDQWPPPGVRR